MSQLEPATALSGALLLDALVNGRPSRRPGFPTGNRRAYPPLAPAGAYRTGGDDTLDGDLVPDRGRSGRRWSTPWATRRGLRTRASPPWRSASRNADDARRAPVESMDRRARDRYDAHGHSCRRAGVPAGAVQDAADRLERDPQLAARGHFTPPRQRRGRLRCRSKGVPFRMSATPPHTGGALHRGRLSWARTPTAVLRDVLGMGDRRHRRLADAGVLVSGSALVRAPRGHSVTAP